MRKIMVIMLTAVIILGMAGCGGSSGKPKDVSDKVYSIAKKYVEISDQYLDGTASIDNAIGMIILIPEELELPNDSDIKSIFKTPSDNSIYESIGALDHLISTAPNALENSIFSESDLESHILKRRNEVAEKINIKNR